MRILRSILMLTAIAGLPVAAHAQNAQTAYGLNTANQLVLFPVDAPGTLLAVIPILDLAPGETVVGLDFHPVTAQLYAVGLSGRLYIVNPHTGRATVVGAGPWTPLTGVRFGAAFDPVSARLRVVSEADINVEFDPATGAVTTHPALTSGGDPSIIEIAYARPFGGVAKLFGIDQTTDDLVEINPATGVTTPIGQLLLDAAAFAGFDFSETGHAYAVIFDGTDHTLYRSTAPSGGSMFPIGLVPPLQEIRGMAILSRPLIVWTVDIATQHLYRFSSVTADILADVPIVGMQPGETMLALDFRPSDMRLYGLGSSNRVYTIDTASGQVTQVGGPNPFAPIVTGNLADIDFDPVTDLLRITNSADINLRMHPDTGVVTVDTPLTGDVWSMGYTNNVPGAATTTLYGSIPELFGFRILRIGGVDGVPPADSGQVAIMSSDGANAQFFTPRGFDIAGIDGTALFTTDGLDLSFVDPLSGTSRNSTFLPSSGDGSSGIAIEPPGRLQLAATEVSVIEAEPVAVVTLNRIGRSSGTIHVDYAVTGVSATAGDDFTASAGTLIFLDGETSKQIVIPIQQEALDEEDEELQVTLTYPFLGTSIIGASVATVTIVDDDPLGSLPPTITITTPTADPAFVSPSGVISIAGTAADDLGVSQVTWSNDRGGAGIAVGTTDWSVPQIPLLPGVNVITVTAIDAGGKVGHDTLTVTLTIKSYAFAEGATGSFFDTDLLLGNHYDSDLALTVTYLKDVGDPIVQNLVLPAQSRTTVHVDEVPGMEAAAFSIVVESSNGLPFAVERTQRWDATGYGAHTEKASDGPSLTWYFAEGSQGFFQTYLLLGNPGGAANEATVRFLIEGAPAVTKVFALAPRARLTISAGDIPEIVNQSFGIAVTFTQPGMAERAMYFGQRLFEGGHASAGVPSASTTWFHAEGATGSFFTSFLLLANPGDTAANATLTYLRDDGAPIVRQKVVPAFSRLTTNIAFEAPELASAAVATRVMSDRPIVSERVMYWPGVPEGWYEAHGSFGVTAASTTWTLAEGRVGGADAAQTFILLANDGLEDAAVSITYYRVNGAPVTKPYVVPATSRVNVFVNQMVPELANEAFSALVTSDRPIVAERAFYTDAGGVLWSAGTNATGTPIP